MKRLVVALTVSLASPAPAASLHLDAATIRRLGIATAPATISKRHASRSAFARVLDPIPLAQLDADILAAEAAAATSSAEASRVQSLYVADNSMSRRAAEAAAMQSRSDRARLALLRRRIALEWGPAIARLSDRQRAELVDGLSSGSVALVRIDSPGGGGLAGLQRVSLDLGSAGSVTAIVIGPARAADAALRSPGLIARVSGGKAAYLASGLAIPASFSAGGPRGAVAIPASAILRVEGGSWIYVQVDRNFVRRRLGGVIATDGGLTAASGLAAGERVVVRGASALYAAETGHAGGAD